MTVYNISTFPQKNNNYFIDTNVLLNLHGINGNISKEEDYTTLIEMIVENNRTVFMDIITISEFINRYMKSLLKDEGVNDFQKEHLRENPIYKKVIKIIDFALKDIKSTYNIQFCNDGYDFLNELHIDGVENILGHLEFNDYAIYQLCKRHNCILVTDDADYSVYKNDIDILTANRKI